MWNGLLTMERGDRSGRVLMALATVLSLVLAACGGGGSADDASTTVAPGDDPATTQAADDPTTVTLQMHFLPEVSWGIYLYGIENGIFSDHGIDLELIPGQGSNFTMQQLSEDQVQFGSASTIAYLAHRAEVGEGTTAVFAVLNEPQAGILTTVPAESLEDLVGTTVGMIPFSVSQVLLPVVLAENDLPQDAIAIESVTYSFGLLFEGTVDGLEAHLGSNVATARAVAEREGIDVYFIALKDQGLVGHPQALVVRDEVIEENPELVRNMVAAMKESIEGVLNADPAEVAALVADYAPELSEEDMLAEWEDYILLLNETGMIDESVIATELGYVSDALNVPHELEPADVYTNEFVPSD